MILLPRCSEPIFLIQMIEPDYYSDRYTPFVTAALDSDDSSSDRDGGSGATTTQRAEAESSTIVMTSEDHPDGTLDSQLYQEPQTAPTPSANSDNALHRTTSSQSSSDLSPIPFPQTQAQDQF